MIHKSPDDNEKKLPKFIHLSSKAIKEGVENAVGILKRTFSIREEANAITVWAFRNGFIEELHAGKYSELLENPKLSRITDAEMKMLNIQISSKIAEILTMRDSNPDEYKKHIDFFLQYCEKWEK